MPPAWAMLGGAIVVLPHLLFGHGKWPESGTPSCSTILLTGRSGCSRPTSSQWCWSPTNCRDRPGENEGWYRMLPPQSSVLSVKKTRVPPDSLVRMSGRNFR